MKYLLLIGLLLFIQDIASSQDPFVTTWETKSPNDTITITINSDIGNALVKYDIIWGDGMMDIDVEGSISHAYTNPGIYAVKIDGSFPGIEVDVPSGNADKLISIDQWGDVKWKTMLKAFKGAEFVTYAASDIPDLSDVTNMESMFEDCRKFDGDIDSWDVSTITNMAMLFDDAIVFNSPLNSWITSSVTTMHRDILSAKKFNQNINEWDVTGVRDFSYMFASAELFDQPLDKWKTARAQNMFAMFSGATNFNQALSLFVMDSVTNSARMFAYSSFNQLIGQWDVSQVINFGGMFDNNPAFNHPLETWNMGSAQDISEMFRNATSFNQPLNGWSLTMDSVVNMSQLFSGALNFNQPLDLWDVSTVTSMWSMFRDAEDFNQPLHAWDVGNVRDMGNMFDKARSFDQNLGSWDLNMILSYGLESMLDSAGLSVENYDATLIGWADNSNTPTGLTLGSAGLTYCESRSKRPFLRIEKNWDISGDHLSSSCEPCENSALNIFYHNFSTNVNTWGNPLMWAAGSVPLPCDQVLINNQSVFLDVDGVAGTLEVTGGVQFEVDGYELTVTGTIEN